MNPVMFRRAQHFIESTITLEKFHPTKKISDRPTASRAKILLITLSELYTQSELRYSPARSYSSCLLRALITMAQFDQSGPITSEAMAMVQLVPDR
jgi:hypothetical protein